jgi:hypothetical protein
VMAKYRRLGDGDRLLPPACSSVIAFKEDRVGVHI